MDATVDSVIRFDASALPPKAYELLWRGLTFPNPEYSNRVRFGRWAGATPEEFTLVEQGTDGEVLIPRGAVGILKAALASVRRTVRFEDRRVTAAPVDYTFALTLRDYQEQAVEALVRHVQGCAVLPCASGKTVIGAGVIARSAQPAIILVHTQDLLDQWCETVAAALGITAGVVAEGRVEPDTITVATVQTLAVLPQAELRELAARFGVVILDECHHAPATVFRRVLSAFPARYRLGLTATPEREDGLTPLLALCIGSTHFEVRHRELVAAGHLIVPRVTAVHTGSSPTADSHSSLVSKLCVDSERNDQLVALTAREARAGRSVLLLSGRVSHCRALATRLQGEGVTAEALTGRVARGRRKEILDAFRAGEVRVVCATSLADEGLDVSRLERLILATPARAEGRTIQRLGRLMRPHPGKETPVLFDLVDDTDLARRHYAARRRAYRKALGRLETGDCRLETGDCGPEDGNTTRSRTIGTSSLQPTASSLAPEAT